MKNDLLHVVVHYPAAEEPFKAEVDRNTTVGQLKAQVLLMFHLGEGQSTGSSVIYILYHLKTPLENLEQSLGTLAGDQKVLQLKLSQQIIQG